MCAAIENKRQPHNSGMRALVVVSVMLAGAVVPSSDNANAATCIALDFDGVGNRTREIGRPRRSDVGHGADNCAYNAHAKNEGLHPMYKGENLTVMVVQ